MQKKLFNVLIFVFCLFVVFFCLSFFACLFFTQLVTRHSSDEPDFTE